MIPELRAKYNREFSEEQFQSLLKDLDSGHAPILFRVAETPVFVPLSFSKKMMAACESIIDVILEPGFIKMTENAVPQNLNVPGETDFPNFLVFDFGVCENEAGELEPQLIEMQGFPSLFAFEVFMEEKFAKHFTVPENFTGYLSGHVKESYIELLKKVITGGHDPQHVVLLEIFPDKQKTNIDFYCTQEYTGVKPVCVTKLIKKGRQLFYEEDGRETQIKRIYNRVIFDELLQQEPWVQEKAKVLFEDLDVEWAPHPNWFYRVSKFTLPLINHPNVPKTWYLNQLPEIPANLENYVLKPLFSFAGQGVVIDVTAEDIAKIKNPENWILQKKVNYATVIETPDEPAKTELRIFYFWEDGAPRPQPVNNLARISKGKMIGVRYNKDKTWTGGSFGLFESEPS